MIRYSGTPNRQTHALTKASATTAALILESGQASIHRVERSMNLATYWKPQEEAGVSAGNVVRRGPTRSMCTHSKRLLVGSVKGGCGDFVWRWIFAY